jgi:H+-transporting ATPase
VLKYLSYFWGPIPWMIEIAAVLSAVVQHWADFGIIAALLVMNAVVGFWEEFQAGNAIAALKKNFALNARVKRDGAWKVIPARELVPGDLARLRIGDIVPADIRLQGDGFLQIDESTLTGESLPVTRKTGDTAYSTVIIKQGEMAGTVVATGTNTYFGKTTHLVESAHSGL